jgi:hypothetical protein
MNNPDEPRLSPRTKLPGTALSWLRMFLGMLFAPQRTMANAKAKRDEVIADATSRGANVEIAELRRILEASKESYEGAAQEAYMRALDDWISFVQAKYGTSIPFDESCKLAEEFEADAKRYCRSR